MNILNRSILLLTGSLTLGFIWVIVKAVHSGQGEAQALLKRYITFCGALAVLIIAAYFFPVRRPALELYATGFDTPVVAIPDPTRAGRWYVAERTGEIFIVDTGQILPDLFLDLRAQVKGTEDDLSNGLLGMAFSPRPGQVRHLYVYLNEQSDKLVLKRFSVSENDPEHIDPVSEVRILDISKPGPVGHNGGMVTFGPDGYLYLGIGDGTNGEGDEAQDNSNLLGTIIRLDVSIVDAAPPYYRIPSDNPFSPGHEARPEIWVYGLRNPWRFAFDMATGGLYVPDVGQTRFEELNYVTSDEASGANFGWNWFEGFAPYVDSEMTPDGSAMIFPVSTYSHRTGCGIIGGYVYRGGAIPHLKGKYLYGDYCLGRIWAISKNSSGEWVHETVVNSRPLLTTFAESQDGEIYVLHQSVKSLSLPGTMQRLTLKWQLIGLRAFLPDSR